MSDSQTTLKAQRTHTFRFKLVAECLNGLKRLTSKCTVALKWGHAGVKDNEIADQLANEGSDSSDTKTQNTN
jgi:ribonuclease HI